MTIPSIFTATESQRADALSTILLAFASDPLVRWFWPTAAQYLEALPLLNAFGGGAVDAGTAFVVNDFSGVALWLPPGFVSNDEAVGEHMAKTLAPEIAGDVFAVLEKMEEFHPDEDIWYLPLIGVDPAYQGQGLGAALMKAALIECDKVGLPAYLESSNPLNISLYQRHGFEVMGEIQIGTSPVVTPMYRPSQS